MMRTRGRGRFSGFMRSRSLAVSPPATGENEDGRILVYGPRPMPWTVAILRGQRVLARTNPDGTLAVEGGRVEIRYRATDPKAYRASAGNLSIPDGAEKFADEAVVAGQEAPSRDAA